MVDNFAFSIGSTCSWTRINTFLLDTGLGEGALGAQETLWSAVGGTSEISLEAGAHRSGALWPALTVGATGIWVAGIFRDNRSN